MQKYQQQTAENLTMKMVKPSPVHRVRTLFRGIQAYSLLSRWQNYSSPLPKNDEA